MKKLVGGLAVSVVLLVGATACGGGDDSGSGASATTAADSALTTAAAGSTSDDPGVKALCDKVDELIASVNANDAARTDAAQEAVRAELQKAKAVVKSDQQKAIPYAACIQKGAQALSGKVADL